MQIFYRSILILIIASVVGCVRSYDQTEAIRSLKVLNTDLTNLFLAANELPETEALRFLWDQPTAPIPFPNEKFSYDKPYLSYSFETTKGVYTWDSISNSFIRESDYPEVSVLFSGQSFNEANFRISEFESLALSSRPEFPVLMEAVMIIDKQQKLRISHTASIADELPLTINTKISGTNYEFTESFNRTRIRDEEGDKGTISSQFIMSYDKDQIIDFSLQSTICYSTMGFYFDKIDFDIQLFGHTISGKIDYGMIDPTAEDYAKSFNRNSSIEIFEGPLRRKVGRIILASVKDGELLDYHIRFSNNKEELLSDYLPIINKILNIKL